MRNVSCVFTLALLVFANSPALGVDSRDEAGYVLLANQVVLRGKVIEEPGYVLIRDGESEIRLDRQRVACWAPSLAGLHQYLIDTRNGSTLHSHLTVARWCIRNEYPAGAVAELIAARRIDPHNEQADRLEQELKDWHERRSQRHKKGTANVDAVESSAESKDNQGSAGGKNISADTETVQNMLDSSAVKLASHELADSGIDENEAILDEHLARFTTDIQPILLNRCGQAACHGTPKSDGFWFEKPYRFDARPNAEMSRKNLAKTIAAIDRQHLEASPILVKALQPHADLDAPPLRPQDRQAAEQLRLWVLSFARHQARDSDMADQIVQAGGGEQSDAKSTRTNETASRVVRVPEVDDPFDPEVFNRRYHPMQRRE